MPNQGPSTPIKYYPDGKKFLPHMGAGRPANVRLKGKYGLPFKGL